MADVSHRFLRFIPVIALAVFVGITFKTPLLNYIESAIKKVLITHTADDSDTQKEIEDSNPLKKESILTDLHLSIINFSLLRYSDHLASAYCINYKSFYYSKIHKPPPDLRLTV